MRVFLHKATEYLIVPQRWEKSRVVSVTEVFFAWSPVQLSMLITSSDGLLLLLGVQGE